MDSGRGECVVTPLHKNHNFGSEKKYARPDLHLESRANKIDKVDEIDSMD